MRKLLSLVLFVLSFDFTCSAAAMNNENDYLHALVTDIQLIKNDNAFWPDFKIDGSPIIIKSCSYDGSNCHLYAFNFTPSNQIWQNQTIDNYTIYYSPNDTYDLAGENVDYFHFFEMPISLIKKPNTIIDGQLSFVDFVNIYDPNAEEVGVDNLTKLSLGRRFLSYMLSEAPSATDRQAQAIARLHARYTGFNDLSNVALLYMETQLMSDYLQSPNEDTLKNFVAIENFRKEHATKDMLMYEYSDLSPFLFYPMIRLKSHAADDLQKMSWNINNRPLSRQSTYYGFSSRDYTEEMIHFISVASMIALEAGDPAWKIEAASQPVGMQSLLMQRYYLNADEMTRRVNETKAHYQFDTIKKMLDDNVQQKITIIQQFLDEYQNSPGIITRINFGHNEVGTPTYPTYDIRDGVYVDSETILSLKSEHSGAGFGEIFSWYNLSYILMRGDYSTGSQYEFKLLPDSTVIIDGAVNRAADLIAAKRQRPFLKINIEGQDPFYGSMNVKVGSKTGGTLDTSHGVLKITLHP